MRRKRNNGGIHGRKCIEEDGRDGRMMEWYTAKYDGGMRRRKEEECRDGGRMGNAETEECRDGNDGVVHCKA